MHTVYVSLFFLRRISIQLIKKILVPDSFCVRRIQYSLSQISINFMHKNQFGTHDMY